MIKIKPNTQHS